MPAEIPIITGDSQQLVLQPGRYPGDLIIEGHRNHVTGAGMGETVIEGGLLVTGNDNQITELTVCGRSRLRGMDNNVDGVEFKHRVSRSHNWALVILFGGFFGVMALIIVGSFLLPGAIRSCQGETKAGFELPEWAKETTRSTGGLFGAASGFVADLSAGRHEAAYGRMSASYRKAVSLDRFRQAVTTHPYLGAARGVTVRKVSTTGGQIGQATGFLQTSDGSVNVSFHFSQETEGWRITGVTLAGSPALSREPVPQRPAPAGCGKDTDCKGNRICVKGECVAPK